MPEKADLRQARAERQAKALRENLKRRKAQSRGRQAQAAEVPETGPAENRKKDGQAAPCEAAPGGGGKAGGSACR